MLAELLASTQHAISQATDVARENLPMTDLTLDDLFELPSDFVALSEGDTAEWAAGFLYAYSGQTVDARDYIVECSVQVPRLNRNLSRAYRRYGRENYEGGNQVMMNSQDLWRKSMAACEETNGQFDEIVDAADQFFAQDDWRDIARANYEANKEMVDHQWQLGLYSWNIGVYFDAAMFYGRCWNILATGKLL